MGGEVGAGRQDPLTLVSLCDRPITGPHPGLSESEPLGQDPSTQVVVTSKCDISIL